MTAGGGEITELDLERWEVSARERPVIFFGTHDTGVPGFRVVPRLIHEVRRLRAELERLRASLDAIVDHCLWIHACDNHGWEGDEETAAAGRRLIAEARTAAAKAAP